MKLQDTLKETFLYLNFRSLLEPEIEWKNSFSRRKARDWKNEILFIVSKREIEKEQFSFLES